MRGYWSYLRVIPIMVGLMSGILSLFRELLLIYRGDQIQAPSLFWRCVWIAFIISAIAAWVIEHQAANAARDEGLRFQADLNRERDNNSPKLVGTIEQTIVGELAGSPGNTACFMNVTVLNKGADSSVLHWAASVAANGVTRKATLHTIADNSILDAGVRLMSSDAIYDKTVSPIQRGGFRRGWLRCSVDGMNHVELAAPGVVWEATFEDFNGTKYSAKHVFSEKTPLTKPQYYPDGSGGLRPVE